MFCGTHFGKHETTDWVIEEQMKNIPFDLNAKCHVAHPILQEEQSLQGLVDPSPGAPTVHLSPSHLRQEHEAG